MPEPFAADCRLGAGVVQDSTNSAHPVFYEDEVDIHLNPTIGTDWQLRRQQKRMVRPGQNEKYYLAGALYRGKGKVSDGGGNSKKSALFISLLKFLKSTHRRKKPSRSSWTITLSKKAGKHSAG